MEVVRVEVDCCDHHVRPHPVRRPDLSLHQQEAEATAQQGEVRHCAVALPFCFDHLATDLLMHFTSGGARIRHGRAVLEDSPSNMIPTNVSSCDC